MRALALLTLASTACGGDPDVPTAAELYGGWTSVAEGTTRRFVFAATDDGTHPELAGRTDVYTIARDGAVGQTGHYAVEEREVTGRGVVDALVTEALSGAGAPGTYGNAILGWTGDTFTINSDSVASGELTYTRD